MSQAFYHMNSIQIDAYKGTGPVMKSMTEALQRIYEAAGPYKIATEAIYNHGGHSSLITVNKVDRPADQRNVNYPENAPLFGSTTARIGGNEHTAAIDEAIWFSKTYLGSTPITLEFSGALGFGRNTDPEGLHIYQR